MSTGAAPYPNLNAAAAPPGDVQAVPAAVAESKPMLNKGSLQEALAGKNIVRLEEEYPPCGCSWFLYFCFVRNKMFRIEDGSGHVMFKMKEESSFCGRQCCGLFNPFDMYLYPGNVDDSYPEKQRIMKWSHPSCKCTNAWFPFPYLSCLNCYTWDCCFGRQYLDIHTTPGDSVLQNQIHEISGGDCCCTSFGIRADNEAEDRFETRMTCCDLYGHRSWCRDVDLIVHDKKSGVQAARVIKKYKCCAECCNPCPPDTYQVDFTNPELGAEDRAAIMSYPILFKYMYF